jgi:hypothetical protein
MRRLARHALHFLMVAVVLVAGGLNGYSAALAAFDVHEHGAAGVHDHGLHDHAGDHDHGDAFEVADVPQGDGDPAASCGLCTHTHAHSCCAYAVPAADLTLKLAHERSSVRAATSHIPHGQLAAPLFRPPRAIA